MFVALITIMLIVPYDVPKWFIILNLLAWTMNGFMQGFDIAKKYFKE